MKKRARSQQGADIKLLRPPLAGLQPKVSEITRYALKLTDREPSLFDGPQIFELEPLVFDDTVPVRKLNDEEFGRINEIVDNKLTEEARQQFDLILSEFVIALVLDRQMPTKRDFLDRLDGIITEIDIARIAIRKLERLIGRRGSDNGPVKTNRGTLSIGQYMKVYLRNIDFEPHFDAVELRKFVALTRKKTKKLVRKQGKPKNKLLHRLLAVLKAELQSYNLPTALPDGQFLGTASSGKSTPFLMLSQHLIGIICERANNLAKHTWLHKKHKELLERDIKNFQPANAQALLRTFRRAKINSREG